MRAPLLALLLVPAAISLAHADDATLPSCKALAAGPVERDPSSIRDNETLLDVEMIVEDSRSTPDARLCTGVAQYRDATTHITYSATWHDAKHTSFDVNAHETTSVEAESRGRSMRARLHPPGLDGTFLVRSVLPFCTDPNFVKAAQLELQSGIAFRDAFYREPDFRVFAMNSNGYGSGVVVNCVATVGNDTTKGDIFIGTNWSETESTRRYQFYILTPGPDGFALANRMWEIGTE